MKAKMFLKWLFTFLSIFIVAGCMANPSPSLEKATIPSSATGTNVPVPSATFTRLPPSATPSLTPNPAVTLAPMEVFQKGVAFTAWTKGIYSLPDSAQVLEQQIVPLGANWIELIVQCYQENRTSIGLDCSSEMVPTDEELLKVIQLAHNNGLRVMLKPMIALSNDTGYWRGQISYGLDDVKWEKWFEEYDRFIIHYAELATRGSADEFCVGTELYAGPYTPATRSGNWRQVIEKVRHVYSGPLVYAANWGDEPDIVNFWDKLDYIGIDAYYPLTSVLHPTVDQLVAGWKEPAAQIGRLAATWKKPVLFTEVGYQSGEGTASTPWSVQASSPVDLQTQANAYEAVFRVFGNQSWWQGAFWWEWMPNIEQGGPMDKDFTAQGKPAEDVLRAYYGAPPRPTPTPTVLPSQRKHILFDESHSERNTISLDQAHILEPSHPFWIYFGMLVDSLKDGFVVDRNTVSPITPEILGQYDALIISAPMASFTVDEISAIRDFVSAGGGLVLLDDCGTNPWLNDISHIFGFTFIPECRFDPVRDIPIDHFVVNDITKTPRYVMNAGERMQLSNGAIPIGTMDDGAIIMASNTLGQGRIVALSDNNFQDDVFSYRGNHVIMKSILQWVTSWK